MCCDKWKTTRVPLFKITRGSKDVLMSKALGLICGASNTACEHGTGVLEHIGDAGEQRNQDHPQHHCGFQRLRSCQGLQRCTVCSCCHCTQQDPFIYRMLIAQPSRYPGPTQVDLSMPTLSLHPIWQPVAACEEPCTLLS